MKKKVVSNWRNRNVIHHEKSIKKIKRFRIANKRSIYLTKIKTELYQRSLQLEAITNKLHNISYNDKKKGKLWKPRIYFPLFERMEALKDRVNRLKQLKKQFEESGANEKLKKLHNRLYSAIKALMDSSWRNMKKNNFEYDYSVLFEEVEKLGERVVNFPEIQEKKKERLC